MPQLVESLAYKQVSMVSVGLDFMLALGLDYDQFGHTIVKPVPQKIEHPIIETPVHEVVQERRTSFYGGNDASPY
jgi:hypothetical protein